MTFRYPISTVNAFERLYNQALNAFLLLKMYWLISSNTQGTAPALRKV
jgi:hypothetical protein